MILNTLNAFEELSLPRIANQLLPTLLELGLNPDDSLAVAGNCARLYFMLGEYKPPHPLDILTRYSLEEIAQLVENNNGYSETGFNESYARQVTNNEPS